MTLGRNGGDMQSVRYHKSGGPSVLRIDEIDTPTPRADEILVEVRAASINPTDAKRRARGAGPTPKTTGSDFAGVVQEVGGDVADFTSGDRVCGTGLHTTRFHQGAFAEYISVPTDIVAPLPAGVSFKDGAAVALVGVTAWRGLIDHGRLKPTDSCLIHGGTGGVGHVAVQLSDHIYANTIATASPDRQDVAKELGADAVVSYRHENLRQAVSEHADQGFDVIFDHRPYEYFTLDVEAAAFNGRIVLYSGLHGEVELSMTALQNNLTVHAMTMSNLATHREMPSIASVLRRVLDLTDQGVLMPRIARTYGLEEAQTVHRAILEDSFVGKLVVVP